jgi:putative FmdB family regulatory protein
MPIYEYRCAKCKKDFECLVFRQDEEVSCPKCKGNNVSRLMSGFAHKSGAGGKMVSSGGGCASCAGGSCSSCH